MNLVERTESFFIQCATVGPCGNMPFGSIIASGLGFPLILLLRLMKYLQTDLYLLSFMVLSLLLCAILETALLSLSPYEYHRVVLGSAIGIFCAFAYQPFAFTWMIVGFVLFHLVRIGVGIIMQQWWQIDFHLLPGILGFLVRDLIAGVATNILFFIIRFFL